MPRSRESASPPSRDRQPGVRQLLLHTLPGRAIVIGLVARIAIYAVGVLLGSVPGFLSIVDTVAGVSLAVGAAYFVFQLIVVAKRRLLWRVRRKLILSYIFIGFIPVLLIVSFFLLCGLLLFFNVSSYLVQARLRALQDRARFLAVNTALEVQRAGGRDVAAILARRQQAAVQDSADASLAIVPAARSCGSPGEGAAAGKPVAGIPARAGLWRHVEPPASAPGWIDCAGFTGLLAYRHATNLPAGSSAAASNAITISGQRL